MIQTENSRMIPVKVVSNEGYLLVEGAEGVAP